jgi:hypothetical protein
VRCTVALLVPHDAHRALPTGANLNNLFTETEKRVLRKDSRSSTATPLASRSSRRRQVAAAAACHHRIPSRRIDPLPLREALRHTDARSVASPGSDCRTAPRTHQHPGRSQPTTLGESGLHGREGFAARGPSRDPPLFYRSDTPAGGGRDTALTEPRKRTFLLSSIPRLSVLT